MMSPDTWNLSRPTCVINQQVFVILASIFPLKWNIPYCSLRNIWTSYVFQPLFIAIVWMGRFLSCGKLIFWFNIDFERFIRAGGKVAPPVKSYQKTIPTQWPQCYRKRIYLFCFASCQNFFVSVSSKFRSNS